MYLEEVLWGLNLGYIFKLIGRTVGIQHTMLSSPTGIKDTITKENYHLQQLKETVFLKIHFFGGRNQDGGIG